MVVTLLKAKLLYQYGRSCTLFDSVMVVWWWNACAFFESVMVLWWWWAVWWWCASLLFERFSGERDLSLSDQEIKSCETCDLATKLGKRYQTISPAGAP